MCTLKRVKVCQTTQNGHKSAQRSSQFSHQPCHTVLLITTEMKPHLGDELWLFSWKVALRGTTLTENLMQTLDTSLKFISDVVVSA